MARHHLIPGLSRRALLAGLLGWPLVVRAGEEPLFDYEGRYGRVRVEESGDRVVLTIDGKEQSALDRGQPWTPVYAYQRAMLAAVAAWRDPALPAEIPGAPARILLLGLGGGSWLTAVRRWYGPLDLTGVELDPLVARAARRWFDVDEVSVRVGDARGYVERSRRRWDLIAVDILAGGALVQRFATAEFFEILARRLNPGGLVLTNGWGAAPWAEAELRSMRSAFPATFALGDPAGAEANRILVGSQALPDAESLARRLRAGPPRRVAWVASGEGARPSPPVEAWPEAVVDSLVVHDGVPEGDLLHDADGEGQFGRWRFEDG